MNEFPVIYLFVVQYVSSLWAKHICIWNGGDPGLARMASVTLLKEAVFNGFSSLKSKFKTT